MNLSSPGPLILSNSSSSYQMLRRCTDTVFKFDVGNLAAKASNFDVCNVLETDGNGISL